MKNILILAIIAILGLTILISTAPPASGHSEDLLYKVLMKQNELLEQQIELLETMVNRPVGWPVELWKACWNGKWLDFTIEEWKALKVEEQIKYARAYQCWYARKKDKPVEKKVLFGNENVPFEMILIPPGKFWMGSPAEEPQRRPEEVQHKVLISKSYWIGKYEVTQKQWKAVMGDDPAHFKGNKRPVEQVSWDRCRNFCSKTGLKLPTEAQWEYACRGGTTTPFNLGEGIDANRVNYNGHHPYRDKEGEYREKTVEVGSLQNGNSWGGYDFHGNVWEWCKDWFGEYSTVEHTDPTGPEGGG